MVEWQCGHGRSVDWGAVTFKLLMDDEMVIASNYHSASANSRRGDR